MWSRKTNQTLAVAELKGFVTRGAAPYLMRTGNVPDSLMPHLTALALVPFRFGKPKPAVRL